MRICLVVEGAYPYIQGGVSSWVNALISQMPEHEFVIQTIAPNRKSSGVFKCTLPENVTELREAFLQDDDIVNNKAKKLTLSKAEREAIRSLVFSRDEQWETIFDMFNSRTISINDLLMGEHFYKPVLDFYNESFGRVVFTDFLWTCRSMFLPIFTILKNKFIEADFYHTMSTGYAGIIAASAGHTYKKPIYLTEHGIYTREREEEIIRASWTRGIYKELWIKHFYMISNCVYKRATRVFSLFDRAQDIQVELGCDRAKAEVIHNGIKFDIYQDIPGKPPDDKFINLGIIARVTPIKDIKTLINAFYYAKERVPELKLYIIGNTEEDPEYYEECLELIGMLGASDIIFTGHVKVLDYIGRLDIGILTSISEGQPLSLMEIMAAGKPCISTQVGDCFDLLNAGDEDGCAGIVVPVMNIGQISNAIVRLAKDEALRKKMGENGRRIVDKSYRDTVFINRYKAVYNEVGKTHKEKEKEAVLWPV